MRVAVLGAGKVGGTLGKKWANAGHTVIFGSRDPGNEKMAALLHAVQGDCSADGMAEAILKGEVLVLTIPSAAVEAFVEQHAAGLNGKVIIDATNKFGAPVINSVGLIQAKAPAAKVFRAFNSLGWENFERPMYGQTRLDHFYCGPEGEQREWIERLIADVGLNPVYVGDLDMLPHVDGLGAIWVALAFRQGRGRRIAFKLLTE
jgi:predicted dinucleotide-binding enzyme